jgi:hypothetical protein
MAGLFINIFAKSLRKSVLTGYIILCTLFVSSGLHAQNVIIVVIDGARYTETFGAQDTFIPNIWNLMKPEGTIYTNFYNDSVTVTNPGHASILTGTWQSIANDGSENPTMPTIFEYYRKNISSSESDNYLVAGANKLCALTYSTHPDYGSDYGASSITNNYTGDLDTYDSLITIMDTYHPGLLLVNFKEVDIKGHTGIWEDYLSAITQVDSLIYQLWL